MNAASFCRANMSDTHPRCQTRHTAPHLPHPSSSPSSQYNDGSVITDFLGYRSRVIPGFPCGLEAQNIFYLADVTPTGHVDPKRLS